VTSGLFATATVEPLCPGVGLRCTSVLSVVTPAGISTPTASLIAAVVAATAALALNALARRREDRNRRRDVYSRAFQTALEWCEGVYRVRRRAADGSEDRELVRHFHELQERIAYYEGWACIEASDVGKSYQRFLQQVMAECRPLLQEAWSRPGRSPTDPTPEDEKVPDLSEAKETFLREVRKHLAAPWETL
jgi:hypothetical protein